MESDCTSSLSCKIETVAILQAVPIRRHHLLDYTRLSHISSQSRTPSRLGSLLRWVPYSHNFCWTALRHRHHRRAVVVGSTENMEYCGSRVPQAFHGWQPAVL